MKKFMKKSAVFIAILLLSGGLLYFVFPQSILFVSMKIDRIKASAYEREITINHEKWTYLEAGSEDPQSPVVVLIHGMGGNKDNWMKMARLMTSYRLIIPDLPGFGNHPLQDSVTYTPEKTSELLEDFFTSLDLKNINLVGVSMGGMVAGYYASIHPERISTLTLMDTAGVGTNNLSEFMTLVFSTGKNPLLYETVNDFYQAMDFILNRKPDIPDTIIQYMVKKKIERLPVEKKFIADYIGSDYYLLDSRLSFITSPTLILWGEKDRIIDVSAVENMKDKIKTNEIVILKDACHAPMICASKETAEALDHFFKAQHKK